MRTKSGTLLLPYKIPLYRNRNFLILFSGQTISFLGNQISQVTIPLLLLALTHSPAQAGLISALGSLPVFLFSLLAGTLVDRWNRKLVMILCDTLTTLAQASLAIALLLHAISLIHIAIVLFLTETLGLFFSLASTAAIPQLVDDEQLTDAMGASEMSRSGMQMFGPLLGPILYGLGQGIPFLADAISTSVSVFSLLFIRAQFQEQHAEVARKHFFVEMREGLSWIWKQPLLRFLTLLNFSLIVPSLGFMLILIVQAQRLHASNTELGIILGASGLGSIFGAALAGPLYRRFGFTRIIVCSTWIWALTWLFYAIAPNPLILGLVNAASFIIVPIYMVIQARCRVTLTPDHLRGRVNAVFNLIVLGSQPFSLALTGFLLQITGPTITVLILFLPQALLAIAVVLKRSSLHFMEKTYLQTTQC